MITRNNTPGRNEPCLCGSGLKYKKCCLMKAEQERNRIMLEQKAKQDGPTLEQAIKLLHGYTQHRVLQHNGTAQTIYRIMKCLEALPASEQRDFVLADFERRINELTGEGMGREAQVTKAIVELMSQYPNPELDKVAEIVEVANIPLKASEETIDVNTDKAESKKEEAVVTAPTLSQETSDEADAELDAAVAGELEGDAKAEVAGDDADEAEIEQLDDVDEDDLL